MWGIGDVITHNIWVLIPLCALLIPIFGIAIGGWTAYLKYRSRREALETLRAFAESGKEPPAALLEAIALRGSRRDRDRDRDWDGEWPGRRSRGDWQEDIETALEVEEKEGARWGRRGVYRATRGMIWSGAVALGFFLAWNFIDRNAGFLIVAIIMSCITAASLLQVLLAVSLTRK